MPSNPPSEQTPLLSRHDEEDESDGANGDLALESTKLSNDRRWATILALTILSLAVLAILGLGFAAPAIVEEYAKEALVLEPTKLSIDSLTERGVRGKDRSFMLYGCFQSEKKPVRDLGRAGTWVVKEIESGYSEVKVYLPQYGDLLLGVAKIPPMKVDVRDHHYNQFDFLADLEAGDYAGVKHIVDDWLAGRLESLTVKAVATIPLKSGLINLGKQIISQELHVAGNQLPTFPKLNIGQLKFDEYGPPGRPDGMKAMADISAMNDFPVEFDVPPLNFDILLRDCHNEFLIIASARTELVHILPRQFVNASVTGMIRRVPTSLTTVCPNSNRSPLDSILGSYLQGKETTVYVRGGDQDIRTPDWITSILRGSIIALPLPGHPFDNLIKNFSLANVHFALPDPDADPDTPESQPKISATVKALVGLPNEMKFNLDVDRVKADADVYYQGVKLGQLDLRQWQTARTFKVGDDMLIESDVVDAPLEIEDGDVFTKVIQQLLFGKGVSLDINASVDVNTVTALGEFVVRKIPAEGKIFVKSIGGGSLDPQVSDLKILETTKTSITLSALVNATNPTEYSAHVPYVNVSITHNETAIGFASAKADVVPGMNSVVVTAVWETNAVGEGIAFANSVRLEYDVDTQDSCWINTIATKVGRSFVRFGSCGGYAETVWQFHQGCNISPVSLFITTIAASAFYNGTEVGTINWKYPFAIDEGESTTPKLPVEWKVDGLGAVRDALGGTLKLDAKADVGVRIGNWHNKVWYEGEGIGAKIRL